MAKGINIAIGADTRAYADAVKKGLIDPTEKAAEALQDLGSDGARDLGRLESSMRDAQDATENTREEIEDLKRELKDVGTEAKRSIGDRTRKATDDAAEGFEELKDEGQGTAREVAASFDGSMESIAGGFQEVAANAFAGFGPAGVVAGLAAAAGIGLVTAELTKQQEEAEETKQALLDMYKEAIDEGRNYLSEAQILAALTDIMLDPEKMTRYRGEAERIGVDVETYVRSQAGSYEDLKLVIDAAREAEANRGELGADANRGQVAKYAAEQAAIQRIIDENQKLIDQHEANVAAAETVATARDNSEKRQRDQISRTRSADQARWEAAARQHGVSLPSPVVPIQVSTPNMSTIVSRLQRQANAQRIRIPGSVFTRNGKEIF